MQHFYISNQLQNEVNSPSLEQSQTIHQSEPYTTSSLRSALLANGIAFGDRGLWGERTFFAKQLVVICCCLSCRTISAWGHEIACLFHGREIERQIDNNRGCRGKKKEGRGEDWYTTIPTHTIRINWYDSYRLVCSTVAAVLSHASSFSSN